MQTKTKSVTKKNEKFQKASAAQKRVMIAKDVLARLAAKKFKPKKGAFIKLRIAGAVDLKAEVCSISTTDKNCECCAYGAMMLSEIGFNDKLTIGQGSTPEYENPSVRHIYNKERGDRLNKFFPASQLKLIELAFESGGGWYGYSEANSQAMRAVHLFRDDTSPARRMKSIMENIVKNGGEFFV